MSHRRPGLLATSLILFATLLVATQADAGNACRRWRAGPLGSTFFYGPTPEYTADQWSDWVMGSNPTANATYTPQSCAVGGTWPSQSAVCDIQVHCWPATCTVDQTYTTQITSDQVPANGICPADMVPDPLDDCNCLTPALFKLKAAGYCDHCKGDPTDVGNGNLFRDEVDYPGLPDGTLRFVRRYNSLAARYNGTVAPPGLLGPWPVGTGWSANFFQRLVIKAQDYPSGAVSIVYAMRPSGQMLVFKRNGAGVLVPDSDIGDRLAVTAGGFTYTTADDQVETYDSAGYLLALTSRGKPTLTLTRNPAQFFPVRVSDSFGHSLNFSYEVDPATYAQHLKTVTDPAGNTITYAYSGFGELASVTYQDSKSRGYLSTVYNSGTAPLMTQLTDEAGVAFATWTYDAAGTRVLTSSNAGGVNSFAFSAIGPAATVTDPLGTAHNYTYQNVNGVFRNIGSNLTCAGCSEDKTRILDANGNVTKRTDYNDNVSCYEYDTARNLQTTSVEGFAPGSICPASLSTYTPTSGTRERKITTSWNATFRLPATITEANRTTSFTYNSLGEALTRMVTDTSIVPNVARTWTYTYNAYGKVLTVDGPRTDVTDVTTYAYYSCSTGYQCGQLQTITDANSRVTTFNTYNAHGQPLTITDPNGVVEVASVFRTRV